MCSMPLVFFIPLISTIKMEILPHNMLHPIQKEKCKAHQQHKN